MALPESNISLPIAQKMNTLIRQERKIHKPGPNKIQSDDYKTSLIDVIVIHLNEATWCFPLSHIYLHQL